MIHLFSIVCISGLSYIYASVLKMCSDEHNNIENEEIKNEPVRCMNFKRK